MNSVIEVSPNSFTNADGQQIVVENVQILFKFNGVDDHSGFYFAKTTIADGSYVIKNGRALGLNSNYWGVLEAKFAKSASVKKSRLGYSAQLYKDITVKDGIISYPKKYNENPNAKKKQRFFL